MTQPTTRLAPATTQVGAVLIPVKDFDQAKGRLEDALTHAQRAQLARTMATHVVQAQQNITVAICCDDPTVAAWAEQLGASMIWCPGTDLNGAVQHGFGELRAAGYASVAIAHSDLPRATSLDHLTGWPGVTIVPDRHRTGSNVLVVPTALDFRFSYGTNSFFRHVNEATRLGAGLRIVHDEDLGWDIDRPADLLLDEASPFAHLFESDPDS